MALCLAILLFVVTLVREVGEAESWEGVSHILGMWEQTGIILCEALKPTHWLMCMTYGHQDQLTAAWLFHTSLCEVKIKMLNT